MFGFCFLRLALIRKWLLGILKDHSHPVSIRTQAFSALFGCAFLSGSLMQILTCCWFLLKKKPFMEGVLDSEFLIPNITDIARHPESKGLTIAQLNTSGTLPGS